jgi:hypothetical protein
MKADNRKDEIAMRAGAEVIIHKIAKERRLLSKSTLKT